MSLGGLPVATLGEWWEVMLWVSRGVVCLARRLDSVRARVTQELGPDKKGSALQGRRRATTEAALKLPWKTVCQEGRVQSGALAECVEMKAGGFFIYATCWPSLGGVLESGECGSVGRSVGWSSSREDASAFRAHTSASVLPSRSIALYLAFASCA